MSEGMKGLVGKRMTQKVDFMGEKLTIKKLSVAEVIEIQAQAKALEGNDEAGFGVLRTVIKSSVEGADDLTDEDFQQFAMDDLSKLSTAIMKFSGIGGEQGK